MLLVTFAEDLGEHNSRTLLTLLQEKMSLSHNNSSPIYPTKCTKSATTESVIKHIVQLNNNTFAILMSQCVEIWEATSFSKLITVPTNKSWELCKLNSNVLSIGCEQEILIVNWKSGSLIDTLALDVENLAAIGHPSLTFFGYWNQFVAVTLKNSPVFEIWCLENKTLVKRLKGHDSQVTCVLAIDSTTLITASSSSLQIWDTKKFTSIIKNDTAHREGRTIIRLCALTSCDLLVSGDDYGGIRVSKAHTLEFIRELWRGGTIELVPLHIIDLGRNHIGVACGRDKKCRVWDVSTGEIIQCYDASNLATNIVMLDRRTIITSSKKLLKLWCG